VYFSLFFFYLLSRSYRIKVRQGIDSSQNFLSGGPAYSDMDAMLDSLTNVYILIYVSKNITVLKPRNREG
jgi:hypothetical protein